MERSAAAADLSAAAAEENPHAGQGMVVLDIGGDIGALVVSAPMSLLGAEIEICPAGRRADEPDDGVGWWQGDWHAHEHSPGTGGGHTHGPAWPHVAVFRRPPSGQAAAIFPGLRDGAYELWLRPDERTALTAEVVGGEVAFAAWPG